LVDVDISVSDNPDASAEIRSLFRWLRRDDDLPGTTVRLAPAAPGPEHMGAASDVLVVALGSGGVGAVLARSLSVWVQHRTSDLKLTFRGEKGTVELDGKRIKDPAAIIEALRKASGE
jgi:membrane-associated two-gene conflict system component 1 (EACC1)